MQRRGHGLARAGDETELGASARAPSASAARRAPPARARCARALRLAAALAVDRPRLDGGAGVGDVARRFGAERRVHAGLAPALARLARWPLRPPALGRRRHPTKGTIVCIFCVTARTAGSLPWRPLACSRP